MKQVLQSLLADGKITQVIFQLRQLTQQDADLHNDVLQISARFADNERRRLSNTSDSGTLGTEQNKINEALLSVINKLDNTHKSVELTPNPSDTQANNAAPNIVQKADKIYNIDHIDNADFS